MRLLDVIIILMIPCLVMAQDPVSWSYSYVKKDKSTYEIKATAVIKDGWHIYSSEQPEDAIACPTTMNLTKNPLITYVGKLVEIGNKIVHRDAEIGSTNNEYKGSVVFKREIKLRDTKSPYAIRGSLEYQACTDEMCLPPKTLVFVVPIPAGK